MVTSGNLPSQPRGQTESRDGGRPFLACMDDLQNISGLSFRQRHQHPFVNDEQVVLLQLSNALLEGALSSGNSQVLQQFRQPHVFHDKGGSHFPECWLSTAGHPALTGQNIQGCLYCWLTSFGRSLQTNLRITLDGTPTVMDGRRPQDTRR